MYIYISTIIYTCIYMDYSNKGKLRHHLERVSSLTPPTKVELRWGHPVVGIRSQFVTVSVNPSLFRKTLFCHGTWLVLLLSCWPASLCLPHSSGSSTCGACSVRCIAKRPYCSKARPKPSLGERSPNRGTHATQNMAFSYHTHTHLAHQSVSHLTALPLRGVHEEKMYKEQDVPKHARNHMASV